MRTTIAAAVASLACAWCEARAAGAIAFKPEADEWAALWPVAAVLAVLVLVAVSAAIGARRLGWRAGAHAGRRVRILERLPLSRQCAVLLLECDGRVLLVGQSGDRLCLIERGFEAGTAPAPHGDAR